ncbi:hypothetical protein HNQ07_002281 [Deinococcus metalli]|uniref:Uncharacterized protein n=1 Tax=Deinococcus metalli TaxID=1141878 RepID=A0A7W8KEP8_9DEIO|nr:hypothetical protein [Deinococcus metalli]MBB5376817.1 hypothetical protein [Deinococcus metalli]GHF45574.1 hypothetical protein GCM10017781_22460 [Deinococcus metalli]
MDALIDVCVRSALLLLGHPVTRGLLFALAALYGVGAGWPAWASGACGLLGVASWAAPLWHGWRAGR